MAYYAVARGVRTGIFETWAEVEPLVKRYKLARYKKLPSLATAQKYLQQNQALVQKVHPPASQNPQELAASQTLLKPSKPLKVSYNSNKTHPLLGNAIAKFKDLGVQTIPLLKPIDVQVKEAASSSSTHVVYCDGGSRNNGRANAVAGYGVYFEKFDSYSASVRLDEIKEFKVNYTNQAAELLAILQALVQIARFCNESKVIRGSSFIIKTDSMYSIKCITTWCNNWKRNGWKNSRGASVENQEIIKTILVQKDLLLKHLRLEFNHVKGHSGNLGNDVADYLVNLACDRMERR